MAPAAGAAASGVHATEQLLFFMLLQLAVIVLAARAGGALATRVGQAVAVGEMVTGILLGPSLLGALAPDLFALVFRSTPAEPLVLLSQVGLLLLMFQIGLEFDFAHLSERHNRRAVWAVAAAGLAAPFALGLGFGWFAPAWLAGSGERFGFTLFVATAFSITALPILGRIMMEFGLTKTRLGVIAISAAALNDVVGWLLLAAVTALATSAFAPGGFALRVAGVAALSALCWWVLRPPLVRFVRSQLGTRHVASAGGADATPAAGGRPELPPTLLGVVLAAVFLGGMATYRLGIFAIFGGFMVGVLLHRERAFAAAWNERVGTFVNVFFLPVFFTYTGLRTDIGSLDGAAAWGWCALLIALATLGKYGACTFAARRVGLPLAEARAVGAMMNTRGLMELVIINVGYDLGVIGREMFTMLVLMAIVSTVVTSPLLRRWLPLAGHPVTPAAVMARRGAA